MPLEAGHDARRVWVRGACLLLPIAIVLAISVEPSCNPGNVDLDEGCLRAGGACYLPGCPRGYSTDTRLCGGAGSCCIPGKCADFGGTCLGNDEVCPAGQEGASLVGCVGTCCLPGDGGAVLAGDAATVHEASLDADGD